jgi:hypothetical protein
MPHCAENLTNANGQPVSWLFGPSPSRTIQTSGAHMTQTVSNACKITMKNCTQNRTTQASCGDIDLDSVGCRAFVDGLTKPDSHVKIACGHDGTTVSEDRLHLNA